MGRGPALSGTLSGWLSFGVGPAATAPCRADPGPLGVALSSARPTFPARDGQLFLAAARSAVAEDFAARGTTPHGGARLATKTVALLALTFVPYLLILTGAVPTWAMLPLAAVVGLGVAGIGFAVAHDALHGSSTRHPALNALIGASMDLIGGSSYLWRITHNVIHHTYTNIHGVDEDLAVSPLLRLSPHAPRRWFHRWQHWYALGLYALTTLFWVFVKDWKHLAARDLGPYRDRRHAPRDVAGVVLGKAVYYTWSIVLPFAVLDLAWWWVAAGIILAHLVAGLTLGIVFQLAHVVEQTAHPEPAADGAMPDAWVVHELATTANFAPGNRLLGWYVGGLNFQVEHHLFPKVCSVHYPRIARIVRRLAAEHQLPYHSHATFRGAVRSHLRTLRAFGAPA